MNKFFYNFSETVVSEAPSPFKAEPTLGDLKAAFAALQYAGVSPRDVAAYAEALDAVSEVADQQTNSDDPIEMTPREWVDVSEEADDGDMARALFNRAKEFLTLIEADAANPKL